MDQDEETAKRNGEPENPGESLPDGNVEAGNADPERSDVDAGEGGPIRAEAWTDQDQQIEIVPELVPARMLNEFVYCPRLAFMMWVAGEFEDNVFTVEGRSVHRRVDRPSPPLAHPKDLNPQCPDTLAYPLEPPADPPPTRPASEVAEPGEMLHTRSVLLSSEELRAIAKIDLVETDGVVATPVDYKRSMYQDEDGGLPEGELAQLCLQGLLLREHGYHSDHGVLYYADVRRRVSIPFAEKLIASTLASLRELLEVARSGRIPPPLVSNPRCDGCSLAGICLPDEVNLLQGRVHEKPRHLVPPSDDRVPMFVTLQGGRVSKRGDELVVSDRDRKEVERVRLIDISHLGVFGNVQITTQALVELTARGLPTLYYSAGGWLKAVTTGMPHKNVLLRERQFAVAANQDSSLPIARSIVAGKIANCRTMLMRNHPNAPEQEVRALKALCSSVEEASRLDSLLGIEGTAARIYFSQFGSMLRPPDGGVEPAAFDFNGRNRRPPRDSVNAMLSLAYALLSRDALAAVLAAGFDPYLGFYHRPRYGRPALALDLMEEFRPLLADSVVITAVNTGVVKGSDFVRGVGAANLTDAGRRRFIAAYARRLDQEVTHPLFGYRISYTRILAVQARLLGRYVNGEIESYPSFRTR
ncbi:MAG: CRISPR-associated endonuclease Cas1 [Coriobacteriia bacterium]|jgi:CRISPR-associated protein Cas1|nr:CRISPR-associated endonuclease Cas1 [Coriobacteriia bacterium]